MNDIQNRYNYYKSLNLELNMQRGQPSDADFDLSNDLLTSVGPDDVITSSNLDVRNYPGGVAGIPEARDLFAEVLRIKPSETLVGNNASLKLMSDVLTCAMLRGLKDSKTPWFGEKPKIIVTLPGYDRHFLLLQELGFDLATVAITANGPDMEAVEQLAGSDKRIKGILFVPTYSNPTGDTISDENVRRLASMKTAAADFTIFADDAYCIHHLTDTPSVSLNLLNACKDAGHPDRVYLFSSTSKVTFASAGLGFMGSSEANIKYFSNHLNAKTIGPNKLEQLRHVKFLRNYPGDITGLMKDHARLIAPKFAVVNEVLSKELSGKNLATWTNPKGGYFISLDTVKPVADCVIKLAHDVGVSLTPAGATFPNGQDPKNSNIRLAPTRPPVEEVKLAMEVVATCIQLASAES
ncbi:MAG: aminotransferase class I/II-fold pyridoxal phosphate-dependent enzyme [Trueperaceae bacterium]